MTPADIARVAKEIREAAAAHFQEDATISVTDTFDNFARIGIVAGLEMAAAWHEGAKARLLAMPDKANAHERAVMHGAYATAIRAMKVVQS